MPRIDAGPDHPLLVRMLREPDRLAALTPHEFSRLLNAAHEARLLGWLLSEIDQRSLPSHAPAWLRDQDHA